MGRKSGWLGMSEWWNVADLPQEINQKLWQVQKKRKQKNNKRLGARDAHQFVCHSKSVLACSCGLMWVGVVWVCECIKDVLLSMCVLAWVMPGFCVCLVQCKQRTMHSVHNHWAPPSCRFFLSQFHPALLLLLFVFRYCNLTWLTHFSCYNKPL